MGFKPKSTDTPKDTQLRPVILKYACQFGRQDCIDDALEAFDQFKKGNPWVHQTNSENNSI